MLLEDVRAYAERKSLPSRTMDPSRAKRLLAGLRRLIDEGKASTELSEALEEERKRKQNFKSDMTEARDNLTAEWETISEEARVDSGTTGIKKTTLVPAFERYRGPISGGLTRWAVKRAGRQKGCMKRGLKGLRQVRTVAMFGDSSASWVYGQTFEERTPKAGDSGDLIHAVLATSADVFVTCDKPFKTTLDRVAMTGLRTMDLPGFVARYAPPSEIPREPPVEHPR